MPATLSRFALAGLALAAGFHTAMGASDAAEAQAYNEARSAASPSCPQITQATLEAQRADCGDGAHSWVLGSESSDSSSTDDSSTDDSSTDDSSTDPLQRMLQDTDIVQGAVLFKKSGAAEIPRWYKITNSAYTSGVFGLATATPEDPVFEITYCPGNVCYETGKTGWAHDVWPDPDWGTGAEPYKHGGDCNVDGLSLYGHFPRSQIKQMYEDAQVEFSKQTVEVRRSSSDEVVACPYVEGCTDSLADNWDPDATIDKVPTACEFSDDTDIDDSSGGACSDTIDDGTVACVDGYLGQIAEKSSIEECITWLNDNSPSYSADVAFVQFESQIGTCFFFSDECASTSLYDNRDPAKHGPIEIQRIDGGEICLEDRKVYGSMIVDDSIGGASCEDEMTYFAFTAGPGSYLGASTSGGSESSIEECITWLVDNTPDWVGNVEFVQFRGTSSWNRCQFYSATATQYALRDEVPVGNKIKRYDGGWICVKGGMDTGETTTWIV